MRQGFGLIELLVVIAIIAILAGLLFPVFARARESGRQSTCIVHQRQIGTALELYEADWQGYPTWSEYWYLKSNKIGDSTTWGEDDPQNRWDAKLLAYVKGKPPTDLNHLDRSGVWKCLTAGEKDDQRTIGVSQGLMYDTVPYDHIHWRYVSSNIVEDPSETIFVGDSGRDGRIAFPYNFDGYKDRYVDKLPYYRRDAPWRHNEGAIYTYADGHAKWEPGNKLFPVLSPLGSTSYGSGFGPAHCSMAQYFAPYEKQKLYHVKLAADYGTVCHLK